MEIAENNYPENSLKQKSEMMVEQKTVQRYKKMFHPQFYFLY